MRGIVDTYHRAVEINDGINRVQEMGQRVGRGTKLAARGIVGMHKQARRGRMKEIAEHVVAGDLLHGDGDRVRALAQLETEWLTFSMDLLRAMNAGQRTYDQWVQVNVVPTLHDWEAFRAQEMAAWTTRLTTSWSAFEQWQERLRRLRELARVQGVELASPEPTPLPKTVWEKGEAGSGGTTDVLWTLLKTCVYAAVGITGVVTLYAVVRDMRGSLRASRVRRLEAETSSHHTGAPGSS